MFCLEIESFLCLGLSLEVIPSYCAWYVIAICLHKYNNVMDHVTIIYM